jgi:hypothetical protein
MNYCNLELDNCALQQYTNFRPLKVVESSVCIESRPHCSGEGEGGDHCACQKGVGGGKSCDRCLKDYWAFTSFGCKGGD